MNSFELLSDFVQNANENFFSFSNHLNPLPAQLTRENDCLFDNKIPLQLLPDTILRKVQKIICNKAVGPDCTLNWLLKEGAQWLGEPVTFIFNTSLQQSTFPDKWKEADVILLPKYTLPNNCNNIRPFLPTSTFGKILERIVCDEIINEIDQNFDFNQFGCRRNRSTIHAATRLLLMSLKALDEGKNVRWLPVDFEKAFGRVNHAIVLQKLITLGVSHYLVKWMHSFLFQRRQRVKFSSHLSNFHAARLTTWTLMLYSINF